jgi:hypothetical protein
VKALKPLRLEDVLESARFQLSQVDPRGTHGMSRVFYEMQAVDCNKVDTAKTAIAMASCRVL